MHRVLDRLVALTLLLALLAIGQPAGAQPTAEASVAAPPPAAAPAPEEVRSLIQLLGNPTVRAWLGQELRQPAAEPPPAEPAQSASLGAASPGATGLGATGFIEWRLLVIRAHLAGLAAALPELPQQLSQVLAGLRDQLAGAGIVRIALLVLGFGALGYGAELLFWRISAPFQARIAAMGVDRPGRRIRTLLARFGFGLALVAAFAIGSVGAFLLFPWTPALRALVLGYLVALLALRTMLVVGRLLFAPEDARYRVVPMNDAEASLWYRWTGGFVGWGAFGYVTIELLHRFGLSRPAADLLAYLLGSVLLAIALRLIWRTGTSGVGRIGGTVLAVAIYVAWLIGAQFVFWALVVAGLLPALLAATRRSIHQLFRPLPVADPDQPAAAAAGEANSTLAVIVDRVARALLIVAGIWVLAWGWGLDLAAFAERDTRSTRLLIGLLNAAIVLLVADLLWQLAKTSIDRKVAASAVVGHGDEGGGRILSAEEQRRRGRMRTLLPMLRIAIMVVLGVMAVLMALSALGVQVGPLIAGAGVVGVAIGFGSQTLVRDIISGLFYLLDDAFRVGEYIVSGNFRGTVEGFSLRSVRLRHHRGPLFTVPFGVLGAVQNLSRDWVIDKISFNVPFDTDIALVKKVVKQVSKEIMADPELAKGILEPLKSQGAATMGDYAMQVRVKFKSVPGEQFVVRRAAIDRIKRAFAEAGIKLAVPTVSVAGGGDGQVGSAVAQQALEMARKPAAS